MFQVWKVCEKEGSLRWQSKDYDSSQPRLANRGFSSFLELFFAPSTKIRPNFPASPPKNIERGLFVLVSSQTKSTFYNLESAKVSMRICLLFILEFIKLLFDIC